MMTAILMFLAALFVLTPLIALHEWGHYIVARLCGVKVLTYSIGFGSKLIGWTSKKTGIEYRIGLIPLGGYVKMLDEREGEVADDEKHLAFNNQHPLKKIAIVVAGPMMNFIITILLFFVLFLQPSEQLNTKIGRIIADSPVAKSGLQIGDKIVAIDGQVVETWNDINYKLANRMGESGAIELTTTADNQSKTTQIPVADFMQGEQKGFDPLTALGALPYRPYILPIIDTLSPDGAGALMGLKSGDMITHINGKKVDDWFDVTTIVRKNPEVLLTFSVLRNEVAQDIKVIPRATKENGQRIGQIGASIKPPKDVKVPEEFISKISYTPIEAIQKSFVKTYELAVMTLSSMSKMITGMIGLDNLSGPITIAEVSKDSFEMGWQQVLSTMALISLSLAVLNLLPIPVLDGGHLVFYTYELIFGKSMSEKVQITGFRVGFTLLLCFMILAIGNDILRIFG